jgi:uncharacterized Fe-S cluster-containing radical SAM superfamily protein
MANRIFYGAGQNARENLGRWIEEVGEPVCFVDADTRKWGQTFPINDGYCNSRGYEITSLLDAIGRFPDYEIWVTLIGSNLPTVRKYLTGLGINKSRIHYFERVGSRWCSFLGRYLVIDDHCGVVFSYCCDKYRETYPTSGNFRKDIENYKKICAEKINELRAGYPSTCDGCFRLQDGEPPAGDPELKEFNLSTGLPGGDKCNLKCVYCTYRSKLDGDVSTGNTQETVYDILKTISEDFGSNAVVYYACGELTVSPYRDKILDLWKEHNWSGQILTNAVIYNRKISDILSLGRVNAVISIDAGTPETFAKIKGADCFEKVVKTLKKYRGGNICLKFILMGGVNDNKADVNGFIELAANLACPVVLARNERDRGNMNIHELEMALHFLRVAKENRLKIDINSRVFSDGDRILLEHSIRSV